MGKELIWSGMVIFGALPFLYTMVELIEKLP